MIQFKIVVEGRHTRGWKETWIQEATKLILLTLVECGCHLFVPAKHASSVFAIISVFQLIGNCYFELSCPCKRSVVLLFDELTYVVGLLWCCTLSLCGWYCFVEGFFIRGLRASVVSFSRFSLWFCRYEESCGLSIPYTRKSYTILIGRTHYTTQHSVVWLYVHCTVHSNHSNSKPVIITCLGVNG